MSGNGLVSHASLIVPIRPGLREGTIEVMAFLYTKNKSSGGSFTSWKFPMETGEPGETPWQTASNGVRDELSDKAEQDKLLTTPTDNANPLDFCSVDPIGSNSQPPPFLVSRFTGDPIKGYEWHDKYVYLIYLNPHTLSHLRKVVKNDGKGEILGVPEFVEIGMLWERMKERGQAFHRAVLFRTIVRFGSNQQSPYYAKYRSILEDPQSLNFLRNRDGLIRFNGDQ